MSPIPIAPTPLYAVVGLALGYATFRKGRANLVSSIVLPSKPVRHPARRAIDIFAIFITVFGAATSLGLGALQINSGLSSTFGVPTNNGVAIAVIAALTGLFVVSAVSGVYKGIKYVSNANVILAVALAAFVLVVGPTLFIVNTFTETIGDYASQIIPMSFGTGVDGGQEWLAGWTLFYWAWWISWAPFVGTFIARISRGRTIRQFVVCVLLVPTFVSIVWFSIMGGAAIRLELDGAGLSDVLADGGTEGALFGLLAQFPLATVTSIVVVTLITLFFVSSADSASVVLGMQSQGGNLAPHRALVVLWGCMIAVTGAVLLLAGGLSAMQTVSILVAAPFLVILAAVCVTLVRQLREEPVTATVPEGVYSVVREHSGGAHAPRPAAAPPAEPEPAPVPPPRDRVAR